MIRTKLTARRSNKKMRNLHRGWSTENNKKKGISPFKIKLNLPVQKTVDIKKNEQVLKTINVQRKSKYFSRRN